MYVYVCMYVCVCVCIFLRQEGSALVGIKALDEVEVYLVHCCISLYPQANSVKGKVHYPL